MGHDSGRGLFDNRFARASTDRAADTLPNTAAHTAPNAATHAASDSAPPRPGPVGDPFNCAVDPENTWQNDKKEWCCRVHHRGCPPTAPPPVVIAPPPVVISPPPPPPVFLPAPVPARPADPYNCADGFANWQAGGGCVTSSEPYDCNAGFANWMQGWSVAKKAWCCSNKGKGCPPAAGGCA